jgi:hypothetical protein
LRIKQEEEEARLAAVALKLKEQAREQEVARLAVIALKLKEDKVKQEFSFHVSACHD